MKRSKILGISLVLTLTAGVALYLGACKKKNIAPINNIAVQNDDYSGYTAEARLVAKSINKFRGQLDDRENVARSGLYMPIDSVIWNVEALFNAEYAFPERKYLETVKQELEFFVYVNDNDEALFSAVADLYDDITNAVRQAYSDDGITVDKSLKAVVVEKGDKEGNRVKVNVYVISGKMASVYSMNEPLDGPFGPGDCWYFGEYGGTCTDPSVWGDAAEIIEDSINYYYSGTIVPNPDFRNLNIGMFRISLDGGEYLDENGEPYIYYYPVTYNAPLYLNYEWLNYYYHRELQVLLYLLPTDLQNQGLLPEIPAFIEVDIVGMLGTVNNNSCYYHKNYVVYGHHAAIPVPELPPVRDLLN